MCTSYSREIHTSPFFCRPSIVSSTIRSLSGLSLPQYCSLCFLRRHDSTHSISLPALSERGYTKSIFVGSGRNTWVNAHFLRSGRDGGCDGKVWHDLIPYRVTQVQTHTGLWISDWWWHPLGPWAGADNTEVQEATTRGAFILKFRANASVKTFA